MIKVIDYDPSITRCDPPKKIRYDRTDFIADTEADISAMNSSNSEYLNYPAGSSVLCLGNGKWYLLNAECNEYLEFKEGGSARTKANLYRSMVSDNGEILVTLDDEIISDGMNVLSIGDTVIVTVTADSGYQVKTITLNDEEIENGAEITVEGDITLIAEFEEASAPSSYTWNGTDTSDKDMNDGSYLYHWVSDNCPYTAKAYVGATIVRKKLDGSDEKTYTVLAGDITDMTEGDSVILAIAEDESTIINVFKNVEEAADGLFFDKSPSDDTYWYVASLTLAQ